MYDKSRTTSFSCIWYTSMVLPSKMSIATNMGTAERKTMNASIVKKPNYAHVLLSLLFTN
jgi:hypothetical protein